MSDHQSNDSSIGEKDRVLGYTAVVVRTQGPREFTAPERAFLLELARWSLKISAASQELPETVSGNIPPALEVKRACFVTLTKGGKLRGCIGQLTATAPLYRTVIKNAKNAALRDPRFPPVESAEVDDIAIEISVLSEPQPIQFAVAEDLLARLDPKKHGVILRIGPRTATFLPQVWEHVPDKVKFMEHLSRKAGGESWGWRGPDVTVSLYEVESFHEEN